MSTYIATIARFAADPLNPFRLITRESLYALGLAALYGALHRAAWGGLLSLAGYAFLAILSKRPPLDWPFALPAVIGFGHLVCARILPGTASVQRPRWLTYGPLAVSALLCASEMFGEPPLMATPHQLEGFWSDDQASLTIAPSVSGAIRNTPILSAYLIPNRSWFGKLLHWRTDYRIRGTLAGGQTFTILLNADPLRLSGTVEIIGHAEHSRLRLQRR